jgi:CubicO group peptidase (beta-lactamase class C family)
MEVAMRRVARFAIVRHWALNLLSVWLLLLFTCGAWAGNNARLPSGADSDFEVQFEHFDGFGYPMHVVHRGNSVSELPRAERPLDVHYSWHGDHTLDEFLARTNTTGFIVLKGGKIVYEHYFMSADQNSRLFSFSVAKSFTSTLVGLAIADGKIESVNQPVTRYLPELKGSGYQAASIQDLLEMSSGAKFSHNLDDPKSDSNVMANVVAQGDGKVRDFLKSITSAEPPGVKFAYNDGNAQVLGWLVTRVTGQSLADYMSQKLWQPLGMEQDATWMADSDGPQGLEAAASCLNATLRDYARFGLLFLNKGDWRGRQIVPTQWVEEATSPQRSQVRSGQVLRGTPLGYGYLWWTLPGSDHAFSAWGRYQQFIYVNPAHGVVIVKTSAYKPDDTTLETLVAFEAICSKLESP